MLVMRIASLLSRASNSYQLKLHSLNDCPHIFEFYGKKNGVLSKLEPHLTDN